MVKLNLKYKIFFMIFFSLYFIYICPVNGDEYDREDIRIIKTVKKLINNGNYNKAENLLQEIESANYKMDILLLKGYLELKQKNYKKSINVFKQIVEMNSNNNNVWLYLGQAYYEIHDFKNAALSLEKAEKAGNKFTGYYILLSESYNKLGKYKESFKLLLKVQKRFKSNLKILKQFALVLLELNLFDYAVKKSKEIYEIDKNDPDISLFYAKVLIKAGYFDKAVKVLECCRLRFNNSEFIKNLALVYALKKDHYSAAKMFEKYALTDSKYFYNAAEHYLHAKNYYKALEKNSLVNNYNRKLKQRFSIYIQSKQIEKAYSLYDEFVKQDLLSDKYKYEFAYICYKTSQYNKAKSLLLNIKSTKYPKILIDISK